MLLLLRTKLLLVVAVSDLLRAFSPQDINDLVTRMPIDTLLSLMSVLPGSFVTNLSVGTLLQVNTVCLSVCLYAAVAYVCTAALSHTCLSAPSCFLSFFFLSFFFSFFLSFHATGGHVTDMTVFMLQVVM
jgi:hypothetical protein